MNIVLYGPTPPKINFTQSPEKGVMFEISNSHQIMLKPGQRELVWDDIIGQGTEVFGYAIDHGWDYHNPPPQEEENKIFREATKCLLQDKLLNLIEAETEKKFFSYYLELCYCDNVSYLPYKKELRSYPALIPQVWVNWIHYDPKDDERAKKAQKQPFRVDFLMMASKLGAVPVVFEIDGPSHFGAFDTQPQVAIDKYTAHLQKDRWLRKQGWNVVRVSNAEVQECMTLNDFREFFSDISGWNLAESHSLASLLRD